MKSKPYDPAKIEKKWQKYWQAKKLYKTEDLSKKPKYYVLDMFPYPSGEGLHVGHPKGYIATDIVARMKRMQGYNVLHPMGFDAFGLPAENYAIKTKTNPEIAVKKNVARYKKQLEMIGFDYDWSREVNTTDPKFYKWTQWIFLKLLEKGLAYESNEPVNWCPNDKTVLANEDVENGCCERCGAVVEKRPMRQWVLKITDYADRLLEDLDLLDWPEHIKESQRNWIGRSEGTEIQFSIFNLPDGKAGFQFPIKVFTARADTLFGATYLVLAPEHEIISKLKNQISNFAEVEKYINAVKNKTEIERTEVGKEKTGIKLKGVKAVNPATGEKIPVWVADYVLGHYGTGAVMAVPAHDERDFEFAKKYDLPIKEVVLPNIIDKRNPPVEGKKIVPRKNVHPIVRNPKTGKYLALKWREFDWITFPMGGVEEGEDIVDAAKREVRSETGFINLKLVQVLPGQVRAEYFAAHKDQNRISFTTAVMFELEDETQVDTEKEEHEKFDVIWLNESQLNYENMTHAEIENWKEKMAPKYTTHVGEGVLIDSGEFTGMNSESARNAIAEKFGKKVVKYKLRDWVFSRQRYWGEPIPVLHGEKGEVIPVAEKDLPVILPKIKSYEPTGTGESPLANIKNWVKVKIKNSKNSKILRRETNTMPQWAGSSWYYLRYMDPKDSKKLVDPAKEKYWGQVDFYVGGAEHATRHLIYARFWHKFLFDIGVVKTKEPFKKLQSVGLIMAEDGRKMSKRYGNVVNPDEVVKTWGADTLRMYEMFMGPFADAIAWNTNNMIGMRRFLERVWRLAQKIQASNSKSENPKIESVIHKAIQKVTADIAEMKFNTAVSTLMVCLNDLEKEEGLPKGIFGTFLQLLAPFAPHITEEIWSQTGNKGSIHKSEWPVFDPQKIVEEGTVIIVQVNGRVRGQFKDERGMSEIEAKNTAQNMVEIAKWLEGKEIKKIIWVPGKLLNYVTN